ncbi:unnamed protein product [Adineta steineri]|uniref:Uncharacterized protein n=1 Tax=Adineta steineri TaxID=433720 RepID=A0A818T7U4_9BILA|nr:unnamed protein product [Adineta steineri]CAF3673619.1 unnamed protein product [Adineta steineri]
MALTIRSLLEKLIEERKKSKSDDDEDFVVVQAVNNEWPTIFEQYFLSPEDRLPQTSTSTTSDDDLIFYVTRKIVNDSQRSKNSVEVFRHHDVKRQPKLSSPDYDWEETTNLNLVLHQFEYTVTTAICIKTSSRHLQIIKRLSTRVYASPSHRDMENKGTEEAITYPKIYFSVDNFEDTFCEMVVNEDQMVCVELVATNPVLNEKKVLFLGSIKYEALKKVYETRATTSTRVAQRMTLGMYTKHRVEFVRMRGPNGKGHAEMAVSRYRPTQSDTTTPESIPTTPVKATFDEENWNKHADGKDNQWVPSVSQSKQNASNGITSEVESDDIRQDLSDETGGFLGRGLNKAMNWVRGSNTRLDQSMPTIPLQTCLTYLTLPCHLIVKDILESNSIPLLTTQ